MPALQYLAKHVRVLLYSGDLDLSCNILGTTATLEQFNWLEQPWHQAERALWRIEGTVKDVAGDYSYLDDGQFGFLVVHKSGHLVPMDRPDVALDLITRLVRGQSYADVAIPSDQHFVDMLQASGANDPLWFPYANNNYVHVTTFLFVISAIMAIFLVIRYHKTAFDFSGVDLTPASTPASSAMNTPAGMGSMLMRSGAQYEMVPTGDNSKNERGTQGTGGLPSLPHASSDKTLQSSLQGQGRGYQQL